MSIKSYKLFIESIKDDLTPTQRSIVKSKWGSKFLDYDAPIKTSLIKDGKWKLEYADKISVLNDIFHTDIEYLKRYLSSFSKHFIDTLRQSCFKPEVSDLFKIDSFIKLDYLTISVFYDNNFRLLNPSDTDSDRRILRDDSQKPILDENNKMQYVVKEKGEPVFTKNVSDISAFIESYNRSYKDMKVINEFDNNNFNNFKSIIEDDKSDYMVKFDLFNNDDMFLYISSNPSDILNMSASEFFTSCQDIYRETGYEMNALSNVFDENSKIAFIIYDTTYYKDDKLISKYMPLSRTMLRSVVDLDNNREETTFIDKCYPIRMEETMIQILDDYADIKTVDHSEIMYQYSPDIDFYDSLYGPYQDTLTNIKELKVVGKNTKYLKLDFDVIDEIQDKRVKIYEDNSVIKLNIDLDDHDYLEYDIDGKNILSYFPKLAWIEWNKIDYSDMELSLLLYKNRISLNKSKINNQFWTDILEEKIYGIELVNAIDSDNGNKMPDISKFISLIELNLLYTYRYLSNSLLDLPKLKMIRISRNIETYNKDLLDKLKKKGVKINLIGL